MPTDTEQRKGILFALAVYCAQGLVPIYFKAVGHASLFNIAEMTNILNYTCNKFQYRFMMHKASPDQPHTTQGSPSAN